MQSQILYAGISNSGPHLLSMFSTDFCSVKDFFESFLTKLVLSNGNVSAYIKATRKSRREIQFKFSVKITLLS